MDKNFVYTCVGCCQSDTIDKDTAQCKQCKFFDQLIVNKTQTALEVGSYQHVVSALNIDPVYNTIRQGRFSIK